MLTNTCTLRSRRYHVQKLEGKGREAREASADAEMPRPEAARQEHCTCIDPRPMIGREHLRTRPSKRNVAWPPEALAAWHPCPGTMLRRLFFSSLPILQLQSPSRVSLSRVLDLSEVARERNRPSAVRAGRVNHWLAALPCRICNAFAQAAFLRHHCSVRMVCSLSLIHFHSHSHTQLKFRNFSLSLTSHSQVAS